MDNGEQDNDLDDSEVKKFGNHGLSNTIGTSPVPFAASGAESLADFWLHLYTTK